MEDKANVRGNAYYKDSRTLLAQLNQVSPSFCLAKWYNVSLHLPTGQTHSCYHPPSHHIPLKEVKIDVSALHNTAYKKSQRKLMLDGQRPSECHFCWEIEDSGQELSDRAYRSEDVFTKGLIEEAVSLGHTGNPKPRYVEVNFNQACNFKCRYCSPHLSTAWMQDIEKNGPIILKDRWHNDLSWMREKNVWPDNSPNNPYVVAFWKWFPTVYENLHTFRMTGGEPLMDKNTFKVFDYVKTHPKNDLHLSITSNCCPPGNQWTKFIDDLKELGQKDAIDHFMLYCSLDSWGPQAEYIRTGMNFDQLLSNIRQYLKEGDRHSLSFINTFNVLSYTGFPKFIENIFHLRQEFNTTRQLIWFDVPQLHYPEWLNSKLTTDRVDILEETIKFMQAHKETNENLFKGFREHEISKVQRLIDWIKSPIDFDISVAKKNFQLFIAESDRRNQTNFLEIFPELNTLYG